MIGKSSWEKIETESQKRKLVDSVLKEIKKLRTSRELSDLLNEGLLVSKISPDMHQIRGDFYELWILKDGQLINKRSYFVSKDVSYRREEEEVIDNSKLPEIIEQYKLTPKDIRKLCKRIQG